MVMPADVLWPPIRRIAMVSVHGCPLMTPGMRSAGGMNVYLRKIAPLLAERDICVDVFTRNHHAGGPELLELGPNARVIHLPAGPPELAKAEIVPYLAEYRERLSRFVAEEGAAYDLVHSHYWLSGGVGSDLAKEWGVPHVVSYHTLGAVKELASDEPEPADRLAAEARMAAAADRVFAFTEGEAGVIGELFGLPSERLHVVPGGVDVSLFRPRDRAAARRAVGIAEAERVVLFVGRLEPFKGPDLLVRALGEMRDVSNVRLVLVGGSKEEGSAEWLERIAADVGVTAHMRWQPAIQQVDLPDFYSAADICAVPSYHESFGLAALEAMACGTPVVATDVGALSSLVLDGETGSLVPSHDPLDFARCLEELLDSPARRERMGRAAQARARAFTWGRAAEEALDGYRALFVAGSRRPEVASCT